MLCLANDLTPVCTSQRPPWKEHSNVDRARKVGTTTNYFSLITFDGRETAISPCILYLVSNWILYKALEIRNFFAVLPPTEAQKPLELGFGSSSYGVIWL